MTETIEGEYQVIQVPATPKELKIINNTRDLLERANEVARTPIKDAKGMEEAGDMLKAIKMLYNNAETERKAIVDPFNRGVKTINERFKQVTFPLAEAESKVKMTMNDFYREQERIAREARIKQEAEEKQRRKEAEEKAKAENKPTPTLAVVPSVPKPKTVHRGENSVVSVKKVMKYRVVDIKALAANCPELVIVNNTEIMKAINDGIHEIAGLEIYEDSQIAVR